MPDLDDRSFASYLAAMQGLANGHELERSGDVVTRPRLWSMDRSDDSFKNKGRFEPPGEEYAGDVAEPPGGNPPLELDPLLLSRWTGPRGGTPTVTWNGQTLEIVLEPASGVAAEPECLVLLHMDAAAAPTTVQHLPLRWAFKDAAATVTSAVSYAGGTLRLVDVRDSAVGIQLNPIAVPEGDAGAMAEGELGDGGVDPAPERQPAIILVDGENMAYAAPEHWWQQHAGNVANWISRSYCDSAQPVVRHKRLCRYEHYEQGTQGTISGWVVAGATDHHLVAVLSQALTSKGFTRLNNYGPQHPNWNKQTAKDNCDEVLRRAYEDLLDANTTLQTTQLVLLNGDGAPSDKGPEVLSQIGRVHVNCFVWAAHEHVKHCTELQEQSDEGDCRWDAINKPVVAVPFDKFNGCSIEWKYGSRSGGAKEVPVNWGTRRTDYVERGRDLLDRVFGASGHQARLSAPTQARLAQFLKEYGQYREPLRDDGLLDGYDAGKSVNSASEGRWIQLPRSIKKWVELSDLPQDALGSKYGLCARAVLGVLRNESPLYTSRQFLYQDLVEKLQPGWARPAVAIAVACLALGVRRTQESDGP